MGENCFPGQLFIACNFLKTTSTAQNFIGVDGDTIRITTNRTISTSTENGFQGEICYDNNFIYICVANNLWKKVALSSF